ncbi:hypothetical protein DV737_g5653, partial [Chaetothyriales sp. CBS 132003]
MPRPPVRAQRRGPPTTRSPRPAGRRQQPRRQSSNDARDQLARKLADKPVGTRPEDSDDSDQLVTKGPGGRRGRFNPMQQIYLSGGLGAGDKPGAHPTRAQRIKSMAKALNSARSSSAVSERPVDRLGLGPASQSPRTNGVVMTARTTPARDGSILEGFKPRKRQLSVLHAAPLDWSSLSPGNDSFALPDDESTPAQAPPASHLPNGTPLSSDSASRKRKLGSCEPLSASRQPGTPLLASDTRASDQKRRRQTLDADEPARANNTREFDIPSDASSDPVGEPDESFLPLSKKRGKRKENTPLECVLDGSGGSQVVVSVVEGESKEKSKKSKWDEIDAFDLQFEDVSVSFP